MTANRVTSSVAQVLHSGSASARVTSFVAQVLHSGSASARVTTAGIQVLRSLTAQPVNAFSRQPKYEYLRK